jgi:hypothetical protein
VPGDGKPQGPFLGLLVGVSLGLAPGFTAEASAQPTRWAVELGGGVLVPFDGNLRESYGMAGFGSIGFAIRLNARDTWIFLESGWFSDTGREAVSDPTFDLEFEYRVIPLHFGVRGNVLADVEEPGPIALYLGFGTHLMHVRREDPFGNSGTAPTIGVFLELRPEIPLGERTSIWARNRLYAAADADIPDAPSFNFSGSNFQMGLSYRP